jgi:hypothetical protein
MVMAEIESVFPLDHGVCTERFAKKMRGLNSWKQDCSASQYMKCGVLECESVSEVLFEIKEGTIIQALVESTDGNKCV